MRVLSWVVSTASSLVLAIGLSSAALTARQAAPPPAEPQTTPAPDQQATFRAATDVVAVDVGVIDRSGRPVRDLTIDEFAITVDGRPRRLRSAEYVALRRLEDDTRPTTPRPFSTNLGTAPGRLIMLVVDQSNIRRGAGREALASAREFVAGLNDEDRVALQLIPGAGPLVEFTSNHVRVMQMLDSVVGQAVEAEQSGRVGIAEAVAIAERDDESTWQEVLERECAGDHDAASLEQCRQTLLNEVRIVHAAARSNTESSLLSLRQIMDRLALTPDAKTLVLVSEGLIVDRDFVDLDWVADRAAEARVTIYGIRLSSPHYDAAMVRTSPTREVDQRLRAEGMDMLVSATRGTVFPVAVNAAAAFTRLDLEISAYYLLSFEPELADRDGKAHEIAVRVTRPGVTVRARQRFVADPPDTVVPVDERLAQALRSSLQAADFELRVATFSYLDTATGQVKVIIGSEVARAPGAEGDVAIGFYVTDSRGGLAAADADTKAIAASPRDARSSVSTSAIMLDPGNYTVKLGAVDAVGRVASVEHVFEAAVPRLDQLRFGDLMFLRPAGPGGGVRPVLDAVIDETESAYAEVYSDVPSRLDEASVVFEIAEDERGPALRTSELALGPAEAGRRVGAATVPAAGLLSGRYVARLVLRAGDQPVWTRVQPVLLVPAEAVGPATLPGATGSGAGASAARPPADFDFMTERLDRSVVLDRPVVGFFLTRLHVVGLPPVPDALTPAIGLARIGRFAEARRIAEEAATGHVVEPFLAGLSLLADGEVNAAALRFGEVLTEAPTLASAAFYLGACYAAAGQDREAVQAWQSMIISDKAAPWGYTLLVDALLRTGNVSMATLVVGEALEIWPDEPDVRLRLARTQALSGEGADAVRTLDAYLVQKPGDAGALKLAMRLIYEARVTERPVESVDADRARFLRYFDAYAALPGVNLTQPREWRTFVLGDE